jgi:short-subunit dehydrogenase
MSKLAVVTGGSKGIGKAILIKLIAEGFDVITCARNSKDLEEVEQEIHAGSYQGRVYWKATDLSERAQLTAFLEFIRSFARPVAILVNNTGVFMPGQINNEAEGVLEKTMETNVYSAYHLTRGVLSGMMEKKQGHIFSICSTASITAYPNGGSYCISKFALLGMTKVLREELKPYSVKVTAVLPGATLTPSWEGVDLPEDRFMKAEDVAETVWSAYNLSAGAVVEEILLRPVLGDI